MDAALKELAQYGALGAIVVILVIFIFWYIKRRDTIEKDLLAWHKDTLEAHEKTILEIGNRHENERAQWVTKTDAMYSNLMKVVERNNAVIAEHTEAIKSTIHR